MYKVYKIYYWSEETPLKISLFFGEISLFFGETAKLLYL